VAAGNSTSNTVGEVIGSRGGEGVVVLVRGKRGRFEGKADGPFGRGLNSGEVLIWVGGMEGGGDQHTKPKGKRSRRWLLGVRGRERPIIIP